MDVKLTVKQSNNPISLKVTQGGGGSGFDYNQAVHKPQINGVTLEGNKTAAELGISGVEVVDEIKSGDMRAITSNAVYIGVGNIEALLHTL